METTSQAQPAPANPPPRKKRRWWFYVLISLGALLALGVSLVLAAALYINSLLKTYAQTQPQTFPPIDASATAQERLKAKWAAFNQALDRGGARVKPLELSPDDLNLAVAMQSGLKDHLRLVIDGDQLKSQFSFPLGNRRKSPQKKIKYLNGEATLKLELEYGFLVLRVASLKANGRPLPRWIFRKVQRQNLLWFLNNYEVLEFLQKLDTVEVRDSAVVLTPYIPENP